MSSVDGYTYMNITDHEFSAFLRRNGWSDAVNKISDCVQFLVGNEIIAVVRYKKYVPVDRWIHLRDDKISQKELEAHQKNCVEDEVKELLEVHVRRVNNLVRGMLDSGMINLEGYKETPVALAKVTLTAALHLSANDYSPIDPDMKDDMINLKNM